MKYKTKFHCKQPRQTRIECSRQIQYHMVDTVQLIFENCSILSLCGNWPCLIGIFSFVWFLWIFSLLSVLARLLKALFQETSLFSTACWMPSHSNFFVIHVEEGFPCSSWSHVIMCLKYLNHFSNTTRFSHWL